MDKKKLKHNLPLYSDRIGLSESTKDPQRSPELKAHAWSKVDQQLQISQLELHSKCTRPQTTNWWWPHAVLPLGDQNMK